MNHPKKNSPIGEKSFKSDARPSDTKSVVLNRERDARLLAHVNQTKRESNFWRSAGYFYLDFMAWLSTQPDAPEPGQPFAVYRAWLESRLLPSPPGRGVGGEGLDPESIAAALLPAMREVLEAVLTTRLAGLTATAGAPAEADLFTLDFADAFSSELVLE